MSKTLAVMLTMLFVTTGCSSTGNLPLANAPAEEPHTYTHETYHEGPQTSYSYADFTQDIILYNNTY